MGLFGPKKAKPTTFKKAIENTAAALDRLEANAVTPEELKNVVDGWQALASELNPALTEMPKEEKK